MNKKTASFLRFLLLVGLIIGMGLLLFYGVTYKGRTLFKYDRIRQGLDLKGGISVVFEAPNATPEDMQKVEKIIRFRLDSKNYTEGTVAIEGENRVRVEIPGITDADKAIEEIGQTALLEFKDEEGNVVLSGDDVAEARSEQSTDTSGTQQVIVQNVALKFSKEGTEKFSKATAENVGKVIFITLDGETISAPKVESAITQGQASIRGSFTADQADHLATLIKSGALPVPLNEPIEKNQIGAQLGADALSSGIKAGIIGTSLVLIFMICVYRVPGLAADLALFFFIVTELLLLSTLQITLTLPGIAGMILTVGMAVDANVIIFERLKEELSLGKTVRTAIENGFSRALPAILDGNVTTLIAAVVLFFLGTGPIKGFATTLILGVLLSMISSLFITRMFITNLYAMGINSPKLYTAVAKKEAE